MSQSHKLLCFTAACLVLMLTGISVPSHGQTITGRLLDAETNSPVSGATVVLRTSDGERVQSTQSDSLGFYLLPNLNQARYVIKARRVGYQASQTGSFSLSSRDTLSINLTLQPSPVAMEEVTVKAEVKRRLQQVGYFERKKTTSGHFLDRTEIKSKEPSRPSELFRDVPGMKMSGQVNAGIKPFIQTVGHTTIKGKEDPCVPTIVINGNVAREGQIIDPATTLRLNDVVSVRDIQAIEVYPRASSGVPVEYAGGMKSPCGTVLIWTGREN